MTVGCLSGRRASQRCRPRLRRVDALIDRGFVVYAINPKQLDRLRDRFSVAGAKDDRRDAYVQADGLRTDPRLFRRLQVADPRLIELRVLPFTTHGPSRPLPLL